MDRREFLALTGSAATASYAGCIEVEINEEPDHDGYGHDRQGDYNKSSEDDQRTVSDELEPDQDDNVERELEEDHSQDPSEPESTARSSSSQCGTGYFETHISFNEGETVYFEEPIPITGGRYSMSGQITNEGQHIRLEYGPSVLYLNGDDDAYFSFETGPYGDIDYGDFNGRFFDLIDFDSEAATVFTGFVKDQFLFNRREAIGLCIDS